MAPPSKSKQQKRRAATFQPGNLYGALEGKDGNPQTPQEFDDSPHDDDEVFFKADEESNETAIKRVLLLNFVHQELHHITERKVPVLTNDEFERKLEIYHRSTYQGQKIDVCVYFPDTDKDEENNCFAMVKLAKDGFDIVDQLVFGDAINNDEAEADKLTAVRKKKTGKNYWVPRWKHVVNILRNEAFNCYTKNGTYVPPPPKPEPVADNPVSDSGELIEEEFEVFYGCTGKIIGPKGETINGIRQKSGCSNIKMPEKSEDGERPKARSKVNVTLSGTARQNAKAKELIQAVVDEWANAPRPPRDGSGGETYTGGGFGDAAAGVNGWESASTPTAAAASNGWEDVAVPIAAAPTTNAGGDGTW